MTTQIPYEEAVKVSNSLLTSQVVKLKGNQKAFDDHRIALHQLGWSLRSLLREAGRRAAAAIEAARHLS